MAPGTRVVYLPVIVDLAKLDEQALDKSQWTAVKFQKTRPCRFYPRCKNGATCPFAHGEKELRTSPNFTKTRMCAGWADGRCKLDPNVCRFAHGPEELRGKAATTSGAVNMSMCSTASCTSRSSSFSVSSTQSHFASQFRTTDGPEEYSPEELRGTDDTSPLAEVSVCSTTASPTSPSVSSSLSTMGGHIVSHASTCQEIGPGGMQPIIAQWIKSVKEARGGGNSEQSDDVPSPEEWQEVLLNALPEQYED
eukprot:CAMPEP_0115178468 /NCGR_PEP_ID=MMETSP0270-20121206/5916_1 /TAXON_ID=71861 /ORGANISM="Scrippsiella trochoidea, Strain CCMP3099" /LENGTH=250 /DNA_ID=CAMNT_0002591431 /DNA_START=81 /DNA_END=833 /DNA_ORIENTATION=+